MSTPQSPAIAPTRFTPSTARQRRSILTVVMLGLLVATPVLSQVSGFVREAGTMAPIPGALVTQQATAVRTEADGDGKFTLSDAIGTDLVIVGASKFYFNASITVSTPVSGVEILLEPVPQDNDPSYVLMEPLVCGSCHPDQYSQWAGSPMNAAGTNTWVYDIYDGTGTPGGMGGFVYTRDSVHAHDNPASECASCHQPEPWLDEPFNALDPIGDLSNGSLHGVSCDVCHKFADIDETKVNFPGLYPGTTTITRPAGPDYHQVQYGLLGDTDYNLPTRMRGSYQPQLDAAVCAACHQDKNDPDGNGDFEEPNGIISEPTYLEWLASPYGDEESPFYKSCVDCHMPSYGATEACIVLDPPIERDPETIRHHEMLGTTPEYLENSVDMSLTCELVGNSLNAEVAITNSLTGHHVPTGVTVRNMILVVEAWREEDALPLTSTGRQIIHDLGGVGDPSQGYYAGLPGKFFGKVNHDATGAGPTFFTDATGIQFDNRIHALETDTSRYSFVAPPGEGTLHVRARLIYRRAFRFLVDAKGWTEDGHGNPLADVAPPYFGHLMEERESVLSTTAVADGAVGATVARTELQQNQPNPANPNTSIRFSLATRAYVTLTVHDASGRAVRTLVQGTLEAGIHAEEWDGRDSDGAPVVSGVYLYRLEAGGTTQTRKMVILK